MTGATERPEAPESGTPGVVRVDRLVRPLVQKLRDAAAQAGHYSAWSGGVLMEQAADEIERLGNAVKAANDQAEHFERKWYLAKEDSDRYAFAKTLEGQVVTMETFKVRGAAELDQALDDAMDAA